MSLDRRLNVEVGEWTLRFPANLPASSRDWSRDLAAAAGVIVIDRAELPRAWVDSSAGVAYTDRVSGAATAENAHAWREDALHSLALAEYLDARPPVDEADVEALAEAVLAEGDIATTHQALDFSRRLLASGRIEVKR